MAKKILYILTKADLGGVSKYLLEIVTHLPKDYEPYFIMSSSGYFSQELEKLGLKNNIYFIPMTNSIFDLKTHINSNLQTLKIIKRIKPDIIHCNSTTGGIVGRICGALMFKPVIFTAHGWAFTDGISRSKQNFYKILETFLAIFTKKIICVSEYDRQIALKVMPIFKNKLVTIHNGLDDIGDEYRKKDFSTDKLKIVMISRFCPQKDPYTLIKAINELNQEGLNIQLDLYGYGEDLEKVLTLIKSCNCLNIKYCGEISDVTPILKNYDVYSLISNWEGLPIGIIEAIRAGLPILVSDVGGCSELINNNGYPIPRGNKDILKNRLKELWNNRFQLVQLGQNSRNLYFEKFGVEKMCKKTFSTYNETLQKKIIIEDGLNLHKKTGQGQYSQNLYEILCEMGFNVEMRRKPFLEKIKNSTIKRILYILWINFIFPIFIIKENCDNIIFTNTLTPLYKIPNKNYYPVLHDLWAYKSPETVTFAQKLYTKFVIFSIKSTYKKIITVSNTVKNEIVDFFKCSPDDVQVVYNTFSFGEKPTISLTEQQQQAALSKFGIESKQYILSVATLNKRKNIPMLIDAYNELGNKDVKLVLVGGASTEKFKNIDNENIIFTGYVDDETLKVLYKNALLYVFPSVYEGFGIPIIDAQAFGIPVICSDIPVFREIANDSAEFFDVSSGNSLTRKLDLFIKEEAIREQYIKQGYINIKKYSNENIINQIIRAGVVYDN